jgi:hypothetical protein
MKKTSALVCRSGAGLVCHARPRVISAWSSFGLEMTHILKLAPCPLCIFQRVLYLVISLFALFGFLLPLARLAVVGPDCAGRCRWCRRRGLSDLDAGFSASGPSAALPIPNLIERLVDWLGMQWPSLFLATGFCTSKEWVFPGLVDCQLVGAGLRPPIAIYGACSFEAVLKKQNPPKGGFVESWRS